MKIIKQSVELLSITHDALELIEQIGRTSKLSKSTGKRNETKEFIQKRINDSHFGLFEHAHASFRIITSRGITHELVRHRLCSFCQESTRYCDYPELILVSQFHPNSIEGIHLQDLCAEVEKQLEFLKTINISKEKIRDLYPTCLKAQIDITTNFRQWMHILKLRLAPTAHPMMQELMKKIYNILYKQYPEIFNLENLKLGW